MAPLISYNDYQGSSEIKIKDDKVFHNTQNNDEEECDELCRLDNMVSIYVLFPLCIFGIIFNFASIGALLNNKLRLRISLIQLFVFLNTSDV